MRATSQVGPSRDRPAICALAAGTVTWCISEPVFWARLTGEGNDPAGALLTWLLYCAVTYIGLVALERFRVTGLAGLFLVGAIVGWLVEGAVVGETYSALPLSIVWTAVAWHALLSVCGGWWLLPAVLRRGGGRAWIACAGAGVAWALWSLDPGLDEDGATLSGPGFAALAFGVTAALAAGYWMGDRHRPGPRSPAPGRPLIIVSAGLAVWATLAVFIPVPFAPPILAVLLGAAVWALRRLRRPAGARRLLAGAGIGAPPARLAPLLALAVSASGVNVALDAAGIEVPSLVVVVTLLTTAAVVALAATIRLVLLSAPDRPRPAPG